MVNHFFTTAFLRGLRTDRERKGRSVDARLAEKDSDERLGYSQ
jgi:hypothetical protein